MENSNGHYGKAPRGIWVGTLIICFGVLVLLRRLGMFIPGWIFTWPMILIAIGLFVGAKKGFRNFGSWALIIIGCFFLARHEGFITFSIGYYLWPLIIITAGIFIIVRPGRWQRNMNWQHIGGAEDMSNDVIDSLSIFYGIRRNVLSKNFKGGEIVNIFGGTEINLTQAAINGTATLDTVAIFGGVNIVVPADWDVRLNVVHIFAGTDDKRSAIAHPDTKNVLIITGTVIFGGVDIRSY